MATRLTTDEWKAELGQHLRDLRLRQNIDLHQWATQGVERDSIKTLDRLTRRSGTGTVTATVVFW